MRETLQSDGEEPRVLRGGSFSPYAPYVRCAFRYRYDARDVDFNVGFRVVLSALPYL